MRRSITGIDHAIVLVRDLDEADARYRRLGFTVAPRGLHPPEHGTGNHTVMLEREYIELMGVVAPTPMNARWRGVLAAGEGVAALALQTPSADAVVAEMAADGVAVEAPIDFARPVALPDGKRVQAAFRTAHFPPGSAPGSHVFCCEHRTRHVTWRPELLEHANGAAALDEVLFVSSSPRDDAEKVAALFANSALADGDDGAFTVATGNSTLRFETAQGLAARFAGADLAGLRGAGPVGIVLTTRSARAAEEALARGRIGHARTAIGVAVSPQDACGVLLVFRGA